MSCSNRVHASSGRAYRDELTQSLWGGAANLGRSDNETIQQRIRRHVERRGGTPAVWFAPDQFCSYSQMNENATVISQALKSASGASSVRVCFLAARLRSMGF